MLIRLLTSAAVGARYHQPGEVIELGDAQAQALIDACHALAEEHDDAEDAADAEEVGADKPARRRRSA